MRTYEEAYAAARDGAPFSNSDQGYSWMARWCHRCIHDREQRGEKITGPGCPLVMVALMGKTPLEWLAETEEQQVYADFTCIEFRDEDGGPGPEPRPIPTPPGQGELIPRESYEGHRMLTPLEPVREVTPC